MRSTGQPRSTVLAFNSVERLLRGDFFHSVSPDRVRDELALFPPDWSVAGVGTTNWYRRHGELLIEGAAGNPRFLWADPEAEPFGAISELETCGDRSLISQHTREEAGRPYLPFAAVAVWDRRRRMYRWQLEDDEGLHVAIAERCEAANIGLAAVRLDGPLREVVYQTICHIPMGGVRPDRPASARKEAELGGEWSAMGFYSANPTVQSVLGFAGASVHLHGRMRSESRGGHLAFGRSGTGLSIEVSPIQDLVVQIPGLDVAVMPERRWTA